MLGSLTGTITARLDQRILIDVSGVGYWVHTGSWQPEGDVHVYLHHHVREDASILYGFPDLPSLSLFERLLTVSGVGPKAALAILSLGSVLRVSEAIRSGDTTFLVSAPGIGQKAAQKIILELHGILTDISTEPRAEHHDIIAALESLGYKAADITPLLRDLPPSITTIDAQIRWVLQHA